MASRSSPKLFEYSPLAEGHIRVIELYPGRSDSDVCVSIKHCCLTVPPVRECKRMQIGELMKTLPPGWIVRETLERRYIFSGPDKQTTFEHPDSTVEPYLYDSSAVQDPYPGAEPQYEALSYRWASDTETEPIHVHSSTQTEPYIMILGNSVVTTLKQLRSESQIRTLWIDAICINQSHTAEKGKQVGRMADIYRLARRVIIWLGPESCDSNLAIESLARFGATREYSLCKWSLGSPGRSSEDYWIVWQSLTGEPLLAICNLLHREWFVRLWIWQEVHVANQNTIIKCGNSHMSYYRFRVAVLALWRIRSQELHPMRKRLSLISQLLRDPPQQEHPFWGLVSRTRYHSSSEPRDRVYALLGWARRLDIPIAEHLNPDYDIPVADVYRNMCVADFKESDTLGLLCMCDLGSRELHGPTWVPDLMKLPQIRLLPNQQRAAGKSRAHVQLQLHMDRLQVYTVLCGTVTVIGPAAPNDLGVEDTANLLQRSEPEDLLSVQYVTGESLLDAHLNSIVAGQTLDRWPGHVYQELSECRKLYLRDTGLHPACARETQLTGGGNDDRQLAERKEFLALVNRHIKGRRVLRTSDFTGIAPAATCLGDVVAVLLGCDLPVILRPATTDTLCPTLHYKVVGFCYIHGLMNGEAVLGPLPTNCEMQIRMDLEGSRILRPFYASTVTGEGSFKDPRLQRVESETGETGLEFEAELEPDALLARGINLKRIILV